MKLRTAPIARYAWLSKKTSVMLTLLFAGGMALPFVGAYLHIYGPVINENRLPAPFPDFRNSALIDLPAKIEAYYNDHVGFRGFVIRGSGLFFNRILGEPLIQGPFGRVLIGKPPRTGEPPWYFYTSEGILEDSLGLTPLTPRELKLWKESLERRAAWLNRRGIEYLFVASLEKSTVYPELMPEYLQNRPSVTRLDQISQYLKDTHSPVRFVDLRPVMARAKSEGSLYFPYDDHWNGLAAFHLYRAVAKALHLAPGSLGRDFEIRPGPQSLRIDLALMLGLGPVAPTPLLDLSGSMPASERPRLAPAQWAPEVDQALNAAHLSGPQMSYALETPGQSRRLLVFHDSFLTFPLFSPESQPLATHFARSYFAWLPPSQEALERFAEWEHPDVVVEERVERLLRNPPPPVAPEEPVSPRLRRSLDRPLFSITQINGASAKNDQEVRAGGELRIEGWALDESGRAPAAGVEVVIDGLPHPAGYGSERADVADQFPCNACGFSGFRVDFTAKGLPPGPHSVTIRVISAGGDSYTERVWGQIRIIG
jgi:hypothetical protein